jgi:predicted nucleotidyltransferase
MCMTEGDGSVHYRAAETFAQRVRDRYGDVVEAVILYGSVARDEQRGADSDVDLLVVLEDGVDRTEYERRVRELAYDVELERGVVLSLQVLTASDYRRGTPFLRQVRGDAERLHG